MKIKKLDVPFTQVMNSLLVNPNISFKAKGLFAYLQSKPDDYDFSSERIPLETKDGTEGVRTGLVELTKHGYLIRRRFPDGRMEYELTDPLCGKAREVKSQRGKIADISNKENIIIKKIYKGKQFTKPSVDEVKSFIKQNNYNVDVNKWWNHYEANGWKVGRNPMKDWKAAVRTWVKDEPRSNIPSNFKPPVKVEYESEEERLKTLQKIKEIGKSLK